MSLAPVLAAIALAMALPVWGAPAPEDDYQSELDYFLDQNAAYEPVDLDMEDWLMENPEYEPWYDQAGDTTVWLDSSFLNDNTDGMPPLPVVIDETDETASFTEWMDTVGVEMGYDGLPPDFNGNMYTNDTESIGDDQLYGDGTAFGDNVGFGQDVAFGEDVGFGQDVSVPEKDPLAEVDEARNKFWECVLAGIIIYLGDDNDFEKILPDDLIEQLIKESDSKNVTLPDHGEFDGRFDLDKISKEEAGIHVIDAIKEEFGGKNETSDEGNAALDTGSQEAQKSGDSANVTNTEAGANGGNRPQETLNGGNIPLRPIPVVTKPTQYGLSDQLLKSYMDNKWPLKPNPNVANLRAKVVAKKQNKANKMYSQYKKKY